MTLPAAVKTPVLLLALSLGLHTLGWLGKAYGLGGAADGLVLLGSALATGCTLLLLLRLQQAASPLG